MHPISSAKPGCYGSPLCYSNTGELCVKCIYKGECEPAAVARSERLAEKFGIHDILSNKVRKPVKQLVTYASSPVVKKPVIVSTPIQINKTEVLIEQFTMKIIADIKDKDMRLSDCIKSGDNPFKTSYPFMGEAFNLLVNGGCTRGDIVSALMNNLGLAENTALTFANVAVRVFVRSGVVERDAARNALIPMVEREAAFAYDGISQH